jgi:tRNA splicing endonuclease
MFSFFKAKYSEDEKKYFDYFKQTLLASSVAQKAAESLAKQILDDAIAQADKAGLRGISTLGNRAVKDENFLNKRLKAGLTKEDILAFLNRDYVLIVAETKLTDAHRFAMYKTLVDDGKTSQEAVKFLRKTFLYCDDPEKSHQNFQGEDADIYPEFTLRHENWRSQNSAAEIRDLASDYTTYNAMVRDLIRKGVI